jgi:hypothetical protein
MKIDNTIKDLLKTYSWSAPALKIKGKIILLPDFAQLFLEFEKAEEVAKYLNCTRVTIANQIKKNLPELHSINGGEIYARILTLIDHRKCYKCQEVKHNDEMHLRNGKADFQCRECSRKHNKSPIAKKQRAAREAKRRACKLQRTPTWADIDAIKRFYIDCPEGYHVDHILPLQGKLVSGFHVLSNLQYLTAHENLSKSNSFDVEYQKNIS